MVEAFEVWILDFLRGIGLTDIEPFEGFSPEDVLWTVILIAVLALIIGVLQCFLGFKAFKVWCSFVGLVLGAIGGVLLVATLIPSTAAYSGVISVFFIVCLGILGAFISFRAYLVGIYIYAFVSLFVLAYLPLSAVVDPNMIAIIVGLCAGIGAGVAVIIFQRIGIIIATCILGGTLIAVGLMLLLGGPEVHMFLAFVLPVIIGLMLAGSGFFVQFATNKKKPETPQPAQITILPMQGVTYTTPDGTIVAPIATTVATVPAPASAPVPVVNEATPVQVLTDTPAAPSSVITEVTEETPIPDAPQSAD